MRVLVGVGAIDAQSLPFEVLKASVFSHRNSHQYTVERIDSWKAYEILYSSQRTDFATVFSLQRFLVPTEAYNRSFDLYLHLDSDMLAIQSLDSLVDIAIANPSKVCVPQPDTSVDQPLQTAVFCGMVSEDVSNLFTCELEKLTSKQVSYRHAMRFESFGDICKGLPHRFNSREKLEDDTVVLHMTDLLRQPWISPFNKLSDVWLLYLERSFQYNNEIKKTLNEGLEKGHYRPGLLEKRFTIKDIFFLPPQYLAYQRRLRLKDGFKFLISRSKFVWALSVHAKGFYRMMTDYRGV